MRLFLFSFPYTAKSDFLKIHRFTNQHKLGSTTSNLLFQ